jgi:hypothetical protein
MAACEWCNEEMTTGASCTVECLHERGAARPLARAKRRCGDCGVSGGGLHHPGCDLQRCPSCGRQLISCGCVFDEDGYDDERLGDEPEGAPIISASKLIGRAFATQLEIPEEPVWSPLEAVARLARSRPDVPSFHAGEFMFMATVRGTREQLAIHLYKHIDTRRYLNLDEDRNAYAYLGPAPDGTDASSGGRYQRYGALVDAITHLELGRYEVDPPLFRSFPPEAWPSDGPTRPEADPPASVLRFPLTPPPRSA